MRLGEDMCSRGLDWDVVPDGFGHFGHGMFAWSSRCSVVKRREGGEEGWFSSLWKLLVPLRYMVAEIAATLIVWARSLFRPGR